MPTWETETDWDNNQSESGVAHESVANTDHDDASIVQKGYDYSSFSEITPDPVVCYPMHEDSGSTIYDMGPQTIDATPSGATLGVTAPLDTTAWGFDGTDDYAESDSTIDPVGSGTSGEVTVAAWVKFHAGFADTSTRYVWGFGPDTDNSLTLLNRSGSWGSYLQEGGSHDIITGSTISSGTWRFLVAVVTPTDHTFYLDASSVATSTHGLTPSNINSSEAVMAARPSALDHNASVDLWDMRIYDQALSASEIQTLYDVVDTDGSFTTSVKSG